MKGKISILDRSFMLRIKTVLIESPFYPTEQLSHIF